MFFDKTIRWGILGSGNIVRRWIKGARLVKNMEITAISSRSEESAGKAASELGIPNAMTYDELLNRPDIDVVYVAVPHSSHLDLASQALEAGKHVLVEKPAAVNAGQFACLAETAKRQNRFLMEAAWTRFFPLAKEIEKTIERGEIGQVRMIWSAFAYRAEPSSANRRLFEPALAGGSLLDVGVYNLHFADMIYRKQPERITGLASFDTDNLHIQVDEQAACIAQYDKGEMAVMSSAIRTSTENTAWIYGTKGHIMVPAFWKPVQMQVITDRKSYTVERPVPQKRGSAADEGYQYEIAHVNECIRKGLIQSPVMTWENSLNILKLCDQLRRDWHFSYPFED